MGISIADIIPRKSIQLEDLKGRIIAIDAFNMIYQFLTTIRQMDGTPLMDKHHHITSHLSGLFYRNINLLQAGIKPIYVFDGKPPSMKSGELENRKQSKIEAKEKYEHAKEEEDVEGMRKYSQQFVKITDEIIQESKDLLRAMGIPVVQALEEGESEAVNLVKHNKAWACASQDYDCLLYGAPVLIRNLTLSKKRKTSSGAYKEINIEMIEFDKLLNSLEISQEQLICLGILVGTDYNPGGIKGIGQKTALEIVKKYKYPVKIFEYVETNPKYSQNINFDWHEIFAMFKEPECCKIKLSETIEFKKPDEKKIKDILTKRDFSEERIDSALNKLKDFREKNKQKTLF